MKFSLSCFNSSRSSILERSPSIKRIKLSMACFMGNLFFWGILLQNNRMAKGISAQKRAMFLQSSLEGVQFSSESHFLTSVSEHSSSNDATLTNFMPSDFSFENSKHSFVVTRTVRVSQRVKICPIKQIKRSLNSDCNKQSELSRIKYGATDSLILLSCFKRKSNVQFDFSGIGSRKMRRMADIKFSSVSMSVRSM